MQLVRAGFPDDPALDVAVGHALLERAARGEMGPTLRVYRPGPTCALGRLDTLSPGFGAAVAAARAHGFEPVLRQPGGRAAAYDSGALCLDQVRPEAEAIPALQARFEEAGALFASALRAVGVDARVGEVPGEYCPGAYSVNARGAVKLSGIGQRMIRGGAHMGGVVVASGGAEVARALVPVYEALELEWDPATSGDVSAELGHPVDPGEIEEALIAELARSYELVDAEIDEETMETALRSLEEVHSGG